ncbi:hypothetical protein HOT99_gp102 [Caulobacter phage CcrBL10]|uniref:Uncharacterized protein n=1 Tax=Caulobacter phage CcrBL10 TaxID=2283269 RepID=A0A385EBZ2_9CAUD|nr:hypothetical protein HOT99_gp102 [Caulobacter phage CcrBL10]AXQ68515.1 hypothetical protein CcrBL10_gp311 [Caulobacter phage CcrBL10]
MPRYSVVDKYVKGKRLTQAQFRRLIVDTVGKVNALYPDSEGARARQIAEALGDPTWLEADNLQVLAQTLVNLRGQKHLHSPARGAYVVNKSRTDMGMDVPEQFERIFHETLVENGGFAQTKTLIAALRVDKGTYGERAAARVLAGSDLCQPHFTGSVWALRNLPPEELAHIPMLGRWVKLRLLYAYRMIMSAKNLKEVDDLAEAEANRHFKRVGSAFRHVLDMIGADLVEEMPDMPLLEEALVEMLEKHPNAGTLRVAATDPYETWGAEYARLKAKGWTDAEIDDKRQSVLDGLLFTMFDWFCDGDPFAHAVAPIGFYTAFADFAGLDAAQLSRGIMEWNLQETSWMKSRLAKAPAIWEAFPEYADLAGSAEKQEA